MDKVIGALGEPTRRRMLEALRQGELASGEIERALNLPQPAASKHLRVLREAGLVQVRKDAQRRIYRIDPRPLAELDAWLSRYRRFWNAALDELSRHLEQEN